MENITNWPQAVAICFVALCVLIAICAGIIGITDSKFPWEK